MRPFAACIPPLLLLACASPAPPRAIPSAPACPSPPLAPPATSAPSTALTSRPPPTSPDPADCEPKFPATAPAAAIVWNVCPNASSWFAHRGLPAVSKDGQRVALAVHDDLAGQASYNFSIAFVDVDSGKYINTVSILAIGEHGEPDIPSPSARSIIDGRIAAANEKLRDLVPMDVDPCAGPLPWPTDTYSMFDGCVASPPPSQTVVCSTRTGAAAPHALSLTLRSPRLYADLDGKKPPFLERDVSAWIQAYDSNFTPGDKGKKDTFVPPVLRSASIDFTRRVLVLQIAYCNTADAQAKFPDAWYVQRLPKLPPVK